MQEKEYEMIKEMKKMQSKLDDAIFKEHQTEFNLENEKMAFMDELGETNHENKASWCWWKKTQKPIDTDALLEELADSWHFALSIDNHMNVAEMPFHVMCKLEKLYFHTYKLSRCYGDALIRPERIIPIMAAITKHLGFTISDVYGAYIEKNKVNYQRLESGY